MCNSAVGNTTTTAHMRTCKAAQQYTRAALQHMYSMYTYVLRRCTCASQQHSSTCQYCGTGIAIQQLRSTAVQLAFQQHRHSITCTCIQQQTATQHQQRHSTPAGQHSSVSRSRATQQTAAQHRLLRYSAAPLILQLCSFAAVMQFCCAVRMLLYMC